MKSILFGVLCFALSACGSTAKQDPPPDASHSNRQIQENQAGFESRCAQGFVATIPGVLNAARSVCLQEIESYNPNNLNLIGLTEVSSFPIALQKGDVLISGDAAGPHEVMVYVGTAFVAKGANISMTAIPVAGTPRLVFNPGVYTGVNFAFGRCFSLGNTFVPCPVPFQ